MTTRGANLQRDLTDAKRCTARKKDGSRCGAWRALGGELCAGHARLGSKAHAIERERDRTIEKLDLDLTPSVRRIRENPEVQEARQERIRQREAAQAHFDELRRQAVEEAVSNQRAPEVPEKLRGRFEFVRSYHYDDLSDVPPGVPPIANSPPPGVWSDEHGKKWFTDPENGRMFGWRLVPTEEATERLLAERQQADAEERDQRLKRSRERRRQELLGALTLSQRLGRRNPHLRAMHPELEAIFDEIDRLDPGLADGIEVAWDDPDPDVTQFYPDWYSRKA